MKISTCYRRCILILLLVVFIIFPAAASAADKTNAKASSPGQLYVTSDKLVAEQGEAMAEFIGHVKATRDDAVLLADRLKVYFKSPDKKKSDTQKSDSQKQGNVEKIVATGHVEYTAGDRKAFADQAVYTTADEKLVLTGKESKLLTGKSWVAGKKITLFRLEERVMVESDGSKRVEAFFDSRDQSVKDGQRSETE